MTLDTKIFSPSDKVTKKKNSLKNEVPLIVTSNTLTITQITTNKLDRLHHPKRQLLSA